MSVQNLPSFDWINNKNQKLPISFHTKQTNPALAVDADVLEGKIKTVNENRPNTDFSKVDEGIIYRNPKTRGIEGSLHLKNNPVGLDFIPKKPIPVDGPGIYYVLDDMARHLSGLPIKFSGSQKPAPTEQPKQPLALLA